ncbi:MAG: PfkB family carbohydrate kinase [Jatrophihabitantaceae bacterium]
MADPADRAVAALIGLAVGDALGMPTQSLPRALIVARYGALVDRFWPAAADHPLAAGLPAGSVTDDTEQAILLAELLIERGLAGFEPAEWAIRLAGWERQLAARGSLDLLGPSTRAALAAWQDGTDPNAIGRTAISNGAAMRIAPVGIAIASQPLEPLLAKVIEVSSVTHRSSAALAGAAAVAATVSAGIDGATVAEAIELGLRAAGLAGERGGWVAGPNLVDRIRSAIRLARSVGRNELIDAIGGQLGTSLASHESVPAAFAVLAGCDGDPWLACQLAASVGGDCDTIAAMAGAMAGACHGSAAFPVAIQQAIEEVNSLRLRPIAGALLALRVPTPAAEPRLLHAGNVVIDLVIGLGRLPDAGSDLLASTSTALPGGGFNVLVAAARLGLPGRYLGAHGSGPFGELARTALAEQGIGLSQLARREQDTGYVLSLITPDGERTFVTCPGAEASIAPADFEAVAVQPRDLVYLSGYSLLHPAGPAAVEILLEKLADQVLVLLDPGPLVDRIGAAALVTASRRADWISCNAREAQLWTGVGDPSAAAAALAASYPRADVLVRLGGHGCLHAKAESSPVRYPAVEVTAVDSSGAGDAHSGALLAALAAGWPVPAAIERANAAAGFAVTRPGPAAGPTEAELARLLG